MFVHPRGPNGRRRPRLPISQADSIGAHRWERRAERRQLRVRLLRRSVHGGARDPSRRDRYRQLATTIAFMIVGTLAASAVSASPRLTSYPKLRWSTSHPSRAPQLSLLDAGVANIRGASDRTRAREQRGRHEQVAAVGLRMLIGFRTLIGRRGPSVSPRAEMVAECDRRPDASPAQPLGHASRDFRPAATVRSAAGG